MKKIIKLVLSILLTICFLTGCFNSKMSVTKYSTQTARYYEKYRNYKAAFYQKEELLETEIYKEMLTWFETHEQSERYYYYVFSDPFSWNIFVYYKFDKTMYCDFEFCMTKNGVVIYVKSNDHSDRNELSDYVIIRIQSPQLTGVVPIVAEFFIDDAQIELGDNEIFS